MERSNMGPVCAFLPLNSNFLRNHCPAQTYHAKRNAVFKSDLAKPDVVSGLFMIILVLMVKKTNLRFLR